MFKYKIYESIVIGRMKEKYRKTYKINFINFFKSIKVVIICQPTRP